MLEVLRFTAFLLLLGSVVSHAHAGDESSGRSNGGPGLAASTSTLIPSPSYVAALNGTATCRSRTINYITHTLPQQCLRTDRVAPNATTATFQSQAGLSTDSLVSVIPTTSSSRLDVPDESLQASQTSTDGLGESSSATIGAISSVISPDTGAVTVLESAADLESPLDNANFLSFDEWKKQNLAKTGQSPEVLGQARAASDATRQRPGFNNALEGLGEESEIDLDFAGFGNAPVASSKYSGEQSATSVGETTNVDGTPSASAKLLLSKDAGKTCKERTNYASFDCAASVLKTNSECKSASSVLVENKDSYMLNTCAAKNKFFIIELCNDIHIDTIVLANYEFFSSIFRHFRVSVSDRYPVKTEKWKDLGTFEARNTREVQAFLVEDPKIWARYLRIEFLSHYGSEYYCPVSLLRVHGKTMMQEFRQEEEMARGESSDDDATLELNVNVEDPVPQEPLASTVYAENTTFQAMPSTKASDPSNEAQPTAVTKDASHVSKMNQSVVVTEPAPTSPAHRRASVFDVFAVSKSGQMHCPSESNSLDKTATSGAVTPSVPLLNDETKTSDATMPTPTADSTQTNTTTASAGLTNSVVTSPRAAAKTALNLTEENQVGRNVNSSVPETSNAALSSQASPAANSTTSVATSSVRAGGTSSTTAQLPQPSSQESFFKSIHKRLQQLESNSTLSLQYIEDQSRILRDAFAKVEKRQIAATTNFLSHLNETVMSELRSFSQAYDQLWQSTVIELEGQREQYQREMLALSSRLTLVADELLWQKRMGIVQSTLLLLCLGLVLFARPGNGYLEMPLAHQLMTKSQAALRAGWESEPNSPSPTSRSPVSLFRRKIWRSSTEAANGHMSDGTESRPETREGRPEVQLEPPTPVLEGEQSEAEDIDDVESLATQRSSSTPNGNVAGVKRPPSWPGDGRAGSPLRFD